MTLAIPGLNEFSTVPLAHRPTPLEELAALSERLGVGRLLIKRDDCTGLAFGGNKTRKLEFTLADALQKGADTLITSGGLQSNHVRQTAAAAARCGLACHAVVDNPLTDASSEYQHSGNQLLDRLLETLLHRVDEKDVESTLERLEARLRAEGNHPYRIPVGASNGIGALGYVECARELLDQCETGSLRPTHVFLATGSAGTHGGLLAGLRYLGSDVSVIGISVSGTAAVKRAKVRDIVQQIERLLGPLPTGLQDEDVTVFDEYVGPGYGIPTEATWEAIRLLARTDAIILDPVYTGKAMAGMLDLLVSDRLQEIRDPVFLHTGGTPALFAYPEHIPPRSANRAL